MSRADAWIMDPFGAQLGRWGGAPSGGVAPQWYDPIVETLTSGGATGYLWLRETGIATAVGQHVQDWEDVTGAVAWSQPGVSSLRPILQAGGLVFDGIDDRMNAAGFDSVLTGSTWTMAVGVTAAVLSNSTLFWSITDNTLSNYIQVATNRRQLVFVPAASLFSLNSVTAPVSVWFSRSGANYVRRVAAVEESASSATAYPSELNTLTLGARRSPSVAAPMNGTVAWVAVTTRALNTAERASINTLLAANGYPT